MDCAALAGVVFDVSASVPAALLILDIGSGSVAAAGGGTASSANSARPAYRRANIIG
jgi:hypothetical protein